MPNAEAPKPRRCLPRWAKVCIGVAGFFVAVTVIPRLYIAIQLHREYAAIRKAGYPATLKELEAWYYAKPIAENAADVYQEAFSKFVSTEKAEGVPEPLGYGYYPDITPDLKAQIAQYAAKNAETLKLLHQATTIPECRFPFRKNPSLNGERDERGIGWQGASLLHLEIVLAAEDGNSDRAYAALDALYRMADSLKSDPFLASGRPWGLWGSGLNHCIGRAQFTDIQLQAIARRLQDAEDPARTKLALIGFRCQGSDHIKRYPAFSRLHFGTVHSRVEALLSIAYWLCGLRGQDELAFLRLADQYIQWSALPPPESWRMEKRAVSFVDMETRLPLQPLTADVLFQLYYCGSPLPLYLDAWKAARFRAARTALAIERYRTANGTLPDALDALVPRFMNAIPTDPFDGQPIRYKTRDKGYVVYSVGGDEKDNGGGDADIPFTVTR
jgi:hypothetical protein